MAKFIQNTKISHITKNSISQKTENTQRFDLSAAKYISTLLLSDGYLLPGKFDIYKSLVSSLFKNRVEEEAELRSYLLELILQPIREEGLVENLKLLAESTQVTLVIKAHVIEHIILSLEHSINVTALQIDDLESLIQYFMLPRSDYSARIDNLDGFNKSTSNNLHNTLKKTGGNIFKQGIDSLKDNPLFTLHQNTGKMVMDFKTTQSLENEKTRALISNLDELNYVINSNLLNQELINLKMQIQDQSYRIALIGEIKHGKSSLFNRLIGEKVSTVGDGTATTASAIELFYSETPSYEVKWLSDEGINRTFKYIKENEDNYHIQEYGYALETLINKQYFKADNVFDGIQSKEDLSNYMCVQGSYALGVEVVRIGNPVHCLKYGATIIDTPGLNDPMKVRDQITRRQALIADTVVFVMRADKFGTESERVLLNEILKTGKLSELLIVMTHIDRIRESTESDRIIEDVRKWLIKVSDNNLLHTAPIYAFDASYDTDKEEKEYSKDAGFNAFVNRLSRPLDRNDTNRKYIEWIKNKRKAISNLALEEVNKFVGVNNDFIQSDVVIGQLDILIEQLDEISTSYLNQVNARIELLKRKIEDDYKSIKFESEQCEQLIKQNLRAAIEAKVRELGDKYSNKDKWSVFNNDTANGIVLRHSHELEYKAQQILVGWEKLISEFNSDINNDFQANVDRFLEIKNQYELISMKDNAYIYSLCQANELFSALGQTIQKAKYLGTGYVLSNGIKASVIIGLLKTAAGVAFPPAIPWIVGGFSLAAIGGKLMGAFDKDRTKHKFIEEKEKNAYETVDNRFEIFNQKTEEIFGDIQNKISENIDCLYGPIIYTSVANTRDMKYQIEIGKKMKADLIRYAKDTILEIEK